MGLDVALRLRLLNELSGPVKTADADLQRLGRSAQRLNGQRGGTQLAQGLRQAEQAASRADRAIGRIGRARQPMQAVATGAHHLSTSLDRVAAAAGRAERATGRLATASGRLRDSRGRSAGAGTAASGLTGDGGLSPAGSTALGASAARLAGRFIGPLGVVYGLRQAAKMAYDLDKAMYDVQRATDESDQQIEKHRQTILRLSRATGKSAVELAGMWAAGGFAGRPIKDLERFTSYAAKATTAWGTNAEETGQAMAEIGNIFKADQARIEEIGDAINTAADSGAAAESDLLEFLRRGSKFGNVMKMSAEEIVAFGSAFKEVGVRTEVAATGFDAFVRKLALASGQNKDFKAAVKALGFSTQAIEKGMRTNAADTIVTVLEAVAKAKDPLQVLAGLGGGEYADDFAALMGQLPKLKEYLKLMRDPRNYKGSVEKGFELAQTKSFNKVQRGAQALNTLWTKLGDGLLAAAGTVAEAMTEVVDSVENGDSALQKLLRTVDGYIGAKRKLYEQEHGERKGWVDETGTTDGPIGMPTPEGWLDRKPSPIFGATGDDAERIGRRWAFQSELDKENAILRRPQEMRENARHMPPPLSPAGAERRRIGLEDAERKAEAIRLKRLPFGIDGPKLDPDLVGGTGPIGKAAFMPVADIGRQFQLELAAAARDSMGGYNAELNAGSVEALRIAQEAADRIMVALSFNATPTIAPRIIAPGISAPAASTPAPQGPKGKSASRGGITVGTVVVNGVTNLAGLQREISRAADRTARGQRDNALHSTGTLA